MRVDAAHVVNVIEAMELCERTHGASVVTRALPFVEALVPTVMAALRVSLGHAAHMRGYHRPELWIGALIEREGSVPTHTRRFAEVGISVHWANPALEVEDVELGCRLMQWLGVLEPAQVGRGVAFSYLCCGFRRDHGETGYVLLQSFVNEVMAGSQDQAQGQGWTGNQGWAELGFVQRIDAWRREHNSFVSAQWARHAKDVLTSNMGNMSR